MTTECQQAPTILCGGCKLASYCSLKCQQADWPAHKLVCFQVSADDPTKYQVHKESIHFVGPSGRCEKVAQNLEAHSAKRSNCWVGETSAQLVQNEIYRKLDPYILDKQTQGKLAASMAVELIKAGEEKGKGKRPAEDFEEPSPKKMLQLPMELIQSVIIKLEPINALTLFDTGNDELRALLGNHLTYVEWWRNMPNVTKWRVLLARLSQRDKTNPVHDQIANAIVEGLQNVDEIGAAIREEAEFYGTPDANKTACNIARLSNNTFLSVQRSSDGLISIIQDVVELRPHLPAWCIRLNVTFSPSLRKISIIHSSTLLRLQIRGSLEWMPQLPSQLTFLDLSGNKFKQNVFDESQLPQSLQILSLRSCELEAAVINHSSVAELWLSHNKLKVLEITAPKLTKLDVNDNVLGELRIDHSTSLEAVSATRNQITEFETSNLSITTLDLTGNPLEKITLDAKNLQTLLVMKSNLETLDITKCPNLRLLQANQNKLKTITINHPELVVANLQNNQLKTANIIAANLRDLDLSDNKLRNFDTLLCPNLRDLKARSNKLQDVDLTGCTGLRSLGLSNNRLVNIALNANFLLMILLNNNRLQRLDISRCPKLEILEITHNSIAGELTIDGQKLTFVKVSHNSITNLRVVAPFLSKLDASNNFLETVDLSECGQITLTNLESNRLRSLSSIFQNPTLPALTSPVDIRVSYNPLRVVDGSSMKATHLFMMRCALEKFPEPESLPPDLVLLNVKDNLFTDWPRAFSPKLRKLIASIGHPRGDPPFLHNVWIEKM